MMRQVGWSIVRILGPAVLIAFSLGAVVADAQTVADSSKLTFWQEGDPGEPMHLRGRIVSATGAPIAGAVVSLRQADGSATYQPDRYNGTLISAGDGSFELRTVLPGQYASAKHIHVNVTHDAYMPLYTEILFRGDPNSVREPSAGNEVVLEEVRISGETVLVGGVELVMSSN